jgi:hypothetical protein
MEQQSEFLSWKVVPARLDATQAAWFLGFYLHQVPVLIGAGLLKPLGHPARNSTKYFATEILEQLRRDENGSHGPAMRSAATGGNPVWLRLAYAGETKIRRHVKIRREANPFDPQWQDYFAERAFQKKFGITRQQAGIKPS